MAQQSHLRAKDGLDLFLHTWQPSGDPRGVVCLIHGLGDHAGRYGHLAETLGEAGYVTLGMDLRGNGRSEGRRGYFPSIETMIDDISLLLDESKNRFPALPCFLYGHSMGGNLVLNYVLRRRPQLAGVIATSPWLELASKPSAALKILAKIMSHLWSTFSSSSHLDAGDLYRTEDATAPPEPDSLLHGTITARLFVEVTRSGKWALEHAAEFSLPLLIMHGSADNITSPKASQRFANAVKSDCMYKLWDGLYHELHNEVEHETIFAYVVDWLNTIAISGQE